MKRMQNTALGTNKSINKNEDMKYGLLAVITILIVFSCNTAKRSVPIHEAEFEEVSLNEIQIVAPRTSQEKLEKKVYRSSATRSVDLLHMDLEVDVDMVERRITGDARLQIKPFFFNIDTLSLDAKLMNVDRIELDGKPVPHINDGSQIHIPLLKRYTRTDTLNIRIQYYVIQRNQEVSGDDNGFYFIEKFDYGDTPIRQLWTQGETEYNSRWFPTIDKPNERFTHSISVIVNNQYTTLSNGLLINQKDLSNNRRMDTWEMSDEHAPYLVSLVVGNFSVVEDHWKNIPLLYLVDEPYEPYAKEIFEHTPEMLSFFSDYTQIEYPWEKYAQVVVRDFVAGAMENTTAVTFGDFVQKTDLELIGNPNDDIVAHEMMHHWFGDLVTAESWANLTLNEGFANYSEYLWREYKYGIHDAEVKRFMDFYQYDVDSKMNYSRPIIDYHYEDKEDMFDSHSYNKGGLVLHMLRNQLGEDAFRAGIHHYLSKHRGQDVELDELRIAFEEVSGIDLNEFFNQWFLVEGHPELNISYSSLKNGVQIHYQQIHDIEKSTIFVLPMEWNIYSADGQVHHVSKMMTSVSDSIFIDHTGEILWIDFNPKKDLIINVQVNAPQDWLFYEFIHTKSAFAQMKLALDSKTFEGKDNDQILLAFNKSLDPYIATFVLNKLDYNELTKASFEEFLISNVNLGFMPNTINRLKNKNLPFELYEKLANKTKNTKILSFLLVSMQDLYPKKTYDYIKTIHHKGYADLILTKYFIMVNNDSPNDFDYMINNWGNIPNDGVKEATYLIGLHSLLHDLTFFEKAHRVVYSNEKSLTRKNNYIDGIETMLVDDEIKTIEMDKKWVLDQLNLLLDLEENALLVERLKQLKASYINK